MGCCRANEINACVECFGYINVVHRYCFEVDIQEALVVWIR